MSDDQAYAIEHLRALLKEMQAKLDARTLLLSQILPHIEYASREHISSSNEQINIGYVAHEYCERYGDLIKQFKDEYGKENRLLECKDSKL